MKILLKIPTKADRTTLAGGIVLRYRPEEKPQFIVHYYTKEGEYFAGRYFETLSRALDEIADMVKRAESHDTGGSIDYWKLGEVE